MGTRFDELTEHMKTMGYVTTKEACDIIGRAPSGTTNRFMESIGIKTIRAGRIIYWRKSDLDKVPPVTPKEDRILKAREVKYGAEPETNYPALSAIAKRLTSIEVRLAVLESYMNDIFTVKNEDEFKSNQSTQEVTFFRLPTPTSQDN